MKFRKYLVTSEEMRALDAAAINEYGIAGVVLMENAGRTTFQILCAELSKSVHQLKAVVVAGPGNNGGDGYVVARYLINHGAEVHTYLLAPKDKIKGDALANLSILEKMTDRIYPIRDQAALKEAAAQWRDSDVIVDAILGTGLAADVRSPYREAIDLINETKAFKAAIDIPSGLDSNTGKVLGAAVKADLTVTYGFQKVGMALYPGVSYCGRVHVVDISIPRSAVEKRPPRAILYDAADLKAYLKARSNPENHKGSFGHLLVVGGSPGKTGAPTMAARAGSIVGAGLVTVAVAASLNPILETKLTEEMTEPLPETAMPGYLGETSAQRVLELSEGKRCLVLGPGLSNRKDVLSLLERILAEYRGLVVIDADGLNALAHNLDAVKNTGATVVLTPHPGEMARLTGLSVREVQNNRIPTARDTAKQLNSWVILKGARTITASPDGLVFVNTTGSPWMASGGQGDVLSGILGGLLAQNIPIDTALPLGVYLHGLAADNVLRRRGPAPVLAGDVIHELPTTLAELTKAEALTG
ncbi:MAG: NAD(P)H-hydrate dehydratase [Desulfomonilaceae bacterium]